MTNPHEEPGQNSSEEEGTGWDASDWLITPAPGTAAAEHAAFLEHCEQVRLQSLREGLETIAREGLDIEPVDLTIEPVDLTIEPVDLNLENPFEQGEDPWAI
jgi:hypothetical protein